MIIQEHSKLNDTECFFSNKWDEQIKNGFSLDDKHVFFEWNNLKDEWAYYSSYVIGAQHIRIHENSFDLIVTPKESFKNLDFLKMFMTCLDGGLEAESFSKIYGINVDSALIDVKDNFRSVLSPLLVVHFLGIVEKIAAKGLKKDYIKKEENLKKIKGRILISQNDRVNVMKKRLDRFYCNFQEMSFNIPENRLLKKALLFCQEIVYSMNTNAISTQLNIKLKQCLSIFENVSDEIEIYEVRNLKQNRLYAEYAEAIRLAKLILQRYDYSISNVKSIESSQKVPPFWIDMPLLYEHYVLGLLRRKYGKELKYQHLGNGNYPDFLLCNDEQLIMDTKYKDVEEKSFEWKNIQQLSGYSRDNKIRNALKVNDYKQIKCVLIYPEKDSDKLNIPVFDGTKSISELFENNPTAKSDDFLEFYRICIELPLCKEK